MIWKTVEIQKNLKITGSYLMLLTFNLIETPFNTFATRADPDQAAFVQTGQTQIRQLLYELPDLVYLCLHMEIWLDIIPH